MTPGLRKLANVGLGGSFVATIILFGIWLFRVLQGAEAASDVLTVVRGIVANKLGCDSECTTPTSARSKANLGYAGVRCGDLYRYTIDVERRLQKDHRRAI
jgi:hypothetical protein